MMEEFMHKIYQKDNVKDFTKIISYTIGKIIRLYYREGQTIGLSNEQIKSMLILTFKTLSKDSGKMIDHFVGYMENNEVNLDDIFKK